MSGITLHCPLFLTGLRAKFQPCSDLVVAAGTEEEAARAVSLPAFPLQEEDKVCVSGCVAGRSTAPPSLVVRESACLFLLHQAGYFPSFSPLVEAGLLEGLVYNENKGMDGIGDYWKQLYFISV